MRKLLIGLMALPLVAGACELDMNNLKCGDLQIYANTTLKEVQDNCLLHRQFMNNRNDKYPGTYEVQFYSTSYHKLVYCDFNSQNQDAVVVGCR